MKGRLLFLNLVLVALVGVVIWRVKETREAAQQREQMVLLQQIQLRKSLPPPPIPAVQAVAATTYVAVAQNMLFSRDRNPTVVVKPPPPPPAPPPMPELPTSSGAMTFNGETSVFLTVRSGGPQKVYRAGETVGPFKLVSVDSRDIVFDWDGQRIERKLADLKPRQSVQAEQQVAYVAPPTNNSNVVMPGSTSSDKSAPGAETGASYRACQVGDNSPNGTIVGGYKKVIAAAMMGTSCHWEPVK